MGHGDDVRRSPPRVGLYVVTTLNEPDLGSPTSEQCVKNGTCTGHMQAFLLAFSFQIESNSAKQAKLLAVTNNKPYSLLLW